MPANSDDFRRRAEAVAYECVDPGVGEEIGLLDDPDLDGDVREALDAHCQICAKCRLEREVARMVGDGLAAGRLHLQDPRRRRRGADILPWAASLALAASLAMVVILPPAYPGTGPTRGGNGPGFIRPVPGEVLAPLQNTLRWRPIPGATSYIVHLKQIDGVYAWSGASAVNSLSVPASAGMPGKGTISAWIEPVPSDLAEPGSIHVTFAREGWQRFLAYRLGAAPVLAKVLFAVGLVTGMGMVWRRR